MLWGLVEDDSTSTHLVGTLVHVRVESGVDLDFSAFRKDLVNFVEVIVAQIEIILNIL
jgi:hypothetical protein